MTLNSAFLDAAENAGYFRMAIPSEWDDKIAQQVSLSANSPSGVASKIEQRHWDILLYFAERAATLAVRRKDRELLKLGLIAAGLSFPFAPDWRDVLLVFPVLYHAAEMLGIDSAKLFREVGGLFGGEVESNLIDFTERSDEDKSLKAMGYQLVQEPDGVRFKRTW